MSEGGVKRMIFSVNITTVITCCYVCIHSINRSRCISWLDHTYILSMAVYKGSRGERGRVGRWVHNAGIFASHTK